MSFQAAAYALPFQRRPVQTAPPGLILPIACLSLTSIRLNSVYEDVWNSRFSLSGPQASFSLQNGSVPGCAGQEKGGDADRIPAARKSQSNSIPVGTRMIRVLQGTDPLASKDYKCYTCLSNRIQRSQPGLRLFQLLRCLRLSHQAKISLPSRT